MYNDIFIDKNIYIFFWSKNIYIIYCIVQNLIFLQYR